MKGQREFSRKGCPTCKDMIPSFWDRHFRCGWKDAAGADRSGGVHGSSPSNPPAMEGGQEATSTSPDIGGSATETSISAAIETVSRATGFEREEVLKMMRSDSGIGRLVVSVYMDERRKRI